MGRSPGCVKEVAGGLNKGSWTESEDAILSAYIKAHGEGNWRVLPKLAGLSRCGKSCRLRWINYLRPDLKRGNFSSDEDSLIITLHALLGNRWSLIAGRIPGRTDNDIKNYWNTHLTRKLRSMGIDPSSHKVGVALTSADSSTLVDEVEEECRSQSARRTCTNSPMSSNDSDLRADSASASPQKNNQLIPYSSPDTFSINSNTFSEFDYSETQSDFLYTPDPSSILRHTDGDSTLEESILYIDFHKVQSELGYSKSLASVSCQSVVSGFPENHLVHSNISTLAESHGWDYEYREHLQPLSHAPTLDSLECSGLLPLETHPQDKEATAWTSFYLFDSV